MDDSEFVEEDGHDPLVDRSHGKKNPLPAETCDPERLRHLLMAIDCFTEAEVCALCRVTPNTIEAWRKRGHGPGFSRVGNRILYPRQCIEAFVELGMRKRNGGHKASL